MNKKDFAFVITQEKEIEAMLDLLGSIAFDINTKFLEPAVGFGNFLIGILKRKFKTAKTKEDIIASVSNIYAVDILDKNVYETRKKVFDFTLNFYKSAFKKEAERNFSDKINLILEQNIIQKDFLKKGKLPFIDHKTKESVIFDCIIGNPPYHIKDGGKQGSAIPLYNKFIQKSKRLNSRFILMIIPAKWYTGGKGLKSFREEMLKDRHIKVLADFINAKECFKEVFLRGGVCYFLRDKKYKGDCKIISHLQTGEISIAYRPLKEKGIDVFIRYNEAITILKKIQAKKELTLNFLISSERPFGLRTFFIGEKNPCGIKVYTNKGIRYIKEEEILKNRELINAHKILIPRAIGLGRIETDKIKPIYSEPNSICTETYNVFGPFKNEIEAKNAMGYINTKFFRFLLGMKKNTMMAPKNVYSFIPIQDFSKKWEDKELFSKYGLTKEEIGFINLLCKDGV